MQGMAILSVGIVASTQSSPRRDWGAGESGRAGEMEELQRDYAVPERVKELAAMEDAITHPLTTPVELCFDWAKELPGLAMAVTPIPTSTPRSSRDHPAPPSRETPPAAELLEFYLVVFRSIRKVSADTVTLYSADAAAHEEARLSGGLLKYWYGILNERRECMAMCIWASREDAMKALHKPAHREAMMLASAMFDMYTLERYSLKVDAATMRPTFTLLGRMSS